MSKIYFYISNFMLLCASYIHASASYDVQLNTQLHYFNDYYIPFLIFYLFYFVDKYFFRIFFSSNKMQAAVNAGMINILTAGSMFFLFSFVMYLPYKEALSFMCIPDMYVFVNLQHHLFSSKFYFQGMVLAAFLCVIFLKMLFIKIFLQEKISLFFSFLILMMARAVQLFLMYYVILYAMYLLEMLINYIPVSLIMISISGVWIGIDFLCAHVVNMLTQEGE